MAIFEQFRAVAAILEESFKLLPKNGRFVALIALLSAILNSFLSSFFFFSIVSVSSDMLVKQYNLDPSSSSGYGRSATANAFEGIMKDFRLLFLVNISFFIGIYIVSLFTTITTVIVLAASHSSKTLSAKDLVLQVVKSWIRPLITSLYTQLLTTGYLFVVIFMVSPLLMFSKTYMLPIAIMVALGVMAYIFFLYLKVVWVLALVVSLMEENNYGIKALGRAEVLVEGKKLQGFILNTSLDLLSIILYAGFKIIGGKKVMANQTLFLISASVFVCLLRILMLAVYTVLYVHCKKAHGEEMELQGSVSYKKLSTEPPFSDAA